MIDESEKARRIALGRHAGAFLRALAGESKGAFATVLRGLAYAVTPAEPESEPPVPTCSRETARAVVRAINEGIRTRQPGFRIEPTIVVNNAYVSRGGDA